MKGLTNIDKVGFGLRVSLTEEGKKEISVTDYLNIRQRVDEGVWSHQEGFEALLEGHIGNGWETVSCADASWLRGFTLPPGVTLWADSDDVYRDNEGDTTKVTRVYLYPGLDRDAWEEINRVGFIVLEAFSDFS